MQNIARPVKQRNLLSMLLLTFVTFGMYIFYWVYKTKHEINALGGTIPTSICFFIPFLNIYFSYCYARDFVHYIRNAPDDKASIAAFALLLCCIPFLGLFVIQYQLNKFAQQAS